MYLPLQEVAKVYHAALSALRNLSLPGMYACNSCVLLHYPACSTISLCADETKPTLFKEGVVDAAIKKLQSTMSFVQFKALGTLRLLSQKQGTECVSNCMFYYFDDGKSL